MERNVPKLRFKGFNDEWKLSNLKKLCDINPKSKQLPDKFVYIDLESIIDGVLIKKNIIELKDAPSRAQRLLNVGDVLFQTVRPYQMNNYLFEYELNYKSVASTGYAQLRCKSCISNNKFIYQALHNKKFNNKVMLRCTGTSYPAINSSELVTIPLRIPSLQEQERIANFLTKVDKIIEKQDEKVRNLEKYKKGMMQKIFSQEIRFKDENGEEYPGWNKEHLGNLVERVVRKNKGNISNRPLTISAQYGLVDQKEFFNKVVASSNLEGYYLLENGEFAYNKSYSNGYPFGAIKRLDKYDNGAVSTLYICFKPKNGLSSDFLCHYFESDMWHKEVAMVAVEGARNHGLLNISVGDFFDTLHKVPCKKEQIQIANFLNNISNLLYKEENKFKELQKWKKALLQQMFV